jgi:hypothetical protein
MKKRFSRCEVAGLAERPAWWQVRCDEIEAGIKKVRKGKVEEIAKSALGMPVWAVSYGYERAKAGTGTWAIGSNSRNMASYRTSESGPQVVMLVCGVHGAEAEAVAGAMNLLSLLETGADLRGKARPGMLELLKEYRLIILPCVNMDGRSVSPDHLRGASDQDFVRASQGEWLDGTLVGYPACKEYAPLPLDKVKHPGGYPNGEGYNIMHDCAPADIRTAEARGLLKLVAEEQADLVLHMHSHQAGGLTLGAPLMAYPLHAERSNIYKSRVHDALAAANLRPATPYALDQRTGVNLVSACAQASGGLSIVFEQSAMAAWTFDEMLETFYVSVETFLQWGHKEPFSPRLSVARGRTA